MHGFSLNVMQFSNFKQELKITMLIEKEIQMYILKLELISLDYLKKKVTGHQI
jgi:hypothetical protein